MIKITGSNGLTLDYKCSCGVMGRCMLKPMGNGTIITTIRCPVCYSNQQVKMKLSEKDEGFVWACVIMNEVTGYELKEEAC